MNEVKELINQLQPDTYIGRYGKIYTDTSDFMRISYGDIIKIGGKHYLVLRDEVERSFGLEDPNIGSSDVSSWKQANEKS